MSTATANNPLQDYKTYVPYDQIKAEHIVPAVKQAIEESEQKLENILAIVDEARTKPEVLTFENSLYAYIELDNILEKAWTPVENLLSLTADDEFRQAANDARPLVVEFYNKISLDPRAYELVKIYSQTSEAKALSGERKRHLENTLRDFKLAGAELPEHKKDEYKKISLELSELCQKFSDNATDSKFELIITDEKDLAGLSPDLKDAAKNLADELRSAGADIPAAAWVVNLDYPSYVPFMQFANSSELRKQLYLKYTTKGTDTASRGLVPSKSSESLDNEEIMDKIFKAKLRKAQLLGFKNYAEYSLATKMAESTEQVVGFLERLAEKSKDLVLNEYRELVNFQKELEKEEGYINSEKNPTEIYPWDKNYLSEKLKKKKLKVDENELKKFLELENCIKGMFHIASELYNIDFRVNKDIPVWHEDVTAYELIDKSTKDLIGTFFMDLFPRPTKRQGAWVMPLVNACKNLDGSYTKPQCTLSCNLTKASEKMPSLLLHYEVQTLFHEFGHALHHLLSNVELEPLSGTSVEWDFVELPSQMHENFCWEKETLNLFAKHYETDTYMPENMMDALLESRTFGEGLACIRQVIFGLFDFTLYSRNDVKDPRRPKDIYMNIEKKFSPIVSAKEANFPAAFSHIFAGGYSAGYYSYKWAEVLDADAFSKFKSEGLLNPKVGQAFRKCILEKGDSEAPMKLFKDFMGREPSEDALIKRMGL